MRPLFAGGADQHVPATAEPAHPGLDRSKREARGDGGVHRVAAVGQHPRADLGCGLVLRRDRAALGSSPQACARASVPASPSPPHLAAA